MYIRFLRRDLTDFHRSVALDPSPGRLRINDQNVRGGRCRTFDQDAVYDHLKQMRTIYTVLFFFEFVCLYVGGLVFICSYNLRSIKYNHAPSRLAKRLVRRMEREARKADAINSAAATAAWRTAYSTPRLPRPTSPKTWVILVIEDRQRKITSTPAVAIRWRPYGSRAHSCVFKCRRHDSPSFLRWESRRSARVN